MTNKSIITTKQNPLSRQNDVANAGAAANEAAAHYLFEDYKQRRARGTVRTHTAALLLWVQYLERVGAGRSLLQDAAEWTYAALSPGELKRLETYAEEQSVSLPVVLATNYCQSDPNAWEGVTWGLVEGFVKWLLQQGYSISSVNGRLSAVKIYARLASKAGVIPAGESSMIRDVRGYGTTEGKRVDVKRPSTRVGHKKAEAIVLTAVQAGRLKREHKRNPQGLRDKLMLCLFLDLGLRASEVSGLRVEDFADPGHVIVYRQKTDTVDRMQLTDDLTQALKEYRPYMRQSGKLLRGSERNGELNDQVMSVRAIGARVKLLGRDVLGLFDLSPHDLRHTWATEAAKGSSPFDLRDAGGWSNMQTPSRYVEKGDVVNERIKLGY